MLTQLNVVGATLNSAPTSGLSAVGGLGATTTKQMDGDRLARIGGFVGSGGGPALDFNRRTVTATEKTAMGIQALLGKIPAVNLDARTATWAA